MPWLQVVRPPHDCVPPIPDAAKHGPGSIWQCEGPACKKKWVVVSLVSGPYFREMEEPHV